jgi:hypothetical protein
MAYRKFNGIEYPVPGVDTAINILRPGARWDLENTTFLAWEDDEGREPPTWEEIGQEVLREWKIYEYYEYERKREQAYPSITEQLDMIYHDLKEGRLNNGTWVTAIEAVKTNYPKPESPKPEL